MMQQPDSRLFRQVMRVRYAIIAVMLIAYTIVWLMAVESIQFAVMTGLLAGEALLSAVLFFALQRRHRALLVHLSLLSDTVASTGLIVCTGYAGSPFPLFYVLIVLAGGLLYGQATGITYLAVVSLANIFVLVQDQAFPMRDSRFVRKPPYFIMGAALPLVAAQMLLVVKLTQRGRYLQTLYENVSDGLLVLNDAGQIVDANSRAAQMTCRTHQELITASLRSLAANGDEEAELVTDRLRRCIGGEPVSFEMALARGDGLALPVEINAQRVVGVSPGLVQAFARDISARRIMEAEIRRQNEELRRINQELQVGRDLALNASRLKSQFLANMSHELRTPLNSIIGYTQFVLEDRERPLPDDQREDLGRVLHAGRHLLDLINGVLDVARIESGRESVSISLLDLRALVESVIDAVAPMAKVKGLSIDYRVEGGLPLLETDEKKLRQVLLNLLANAVKFTDRGSVRVICTRADAGALRVAVSDTGIGIPAEHLDDIFSEFHQVDPSIHKRYGGTGLGLAIARRLTDLLKGTIQVESVPGAGSTFILTIPLRLSAAEATVHALPAPPPTSQAGPVERRGAVLVVDDQQDARLMIARQLSDAGYPVCTAASSEEAVRIARQVSPAAITLDLLLNGERDGLETLELLKGDAATRDIPVVIVSVAQDSVAGEIPGAAACVAKPVRPGQLRDVLDALGVRPSPPAETATGVSMP